MNSIFVLFLGLLSKSFASINVAVIGGGLGGASSAYFLKQLCKFDVNIDLYEANKVGGRLATAKVNGHYYEIGGSIIHSKNKYMSQFVEKFGLEKKNECSDTFGIFKRNEMIFKSSQYNFITFFRMWWRFGMDVWHMLSFIDKVIEDFSSVYNVNDSSKYPVDSAYGLLALASKELLELLDVSTNEGFKRMGYKSQIVEELIAPIINCNYCQSSNVHQFVGSVAIAGADGNLWSVKGGNWQVTEKLIKHSGATFINKLVTTITYNKNTTFLVSTNDSRTVYDYVILAAPVNRESKIDFQNFESQPELEQYHTTICTLVEGKVNARMFVTGKELLPDTLLFTGGYKLNALAKVHSVDGECSESSVWKIFSESRLTKQDLDLLFTEYSVTSVTDWLAYPEYDNHARNKSFFLFESSKNIYHINAVEALASAMEMSAIGGHNVASLVNRDIIKRKVASDKHISESPREIHQEL